MPQRGFWAIEPTRVICFGKDGRWYANDEPIGNRRINMLFSQCLQLNHNGQYELVVGKDRTLVQVEDTPYVVTGVALTPEGDFIISLNDNSEETLAPETLTIGDGHVLYCTVKERTFSARFLRHAYYQLAEYIDEQPRGAAYVLRVRQGTFQILPKSKLPNDK